MSKKARRSGSTALLPTAVETIFHRADVLYALEWAAVAPGIGGWNLALDDEAQTRIVSVVPPGAETACFYVTRAGTEVMITWLRGKTGDGVLVEVGRFATLREAVHALCPLSDEQREAANEAMELLYPRDMRDE